MLRNCPANCLDLIEVLAAAQPDMGNLAGPHQAGDEAG
jgi:hypothetical protein